MAAGPPVPAMWRTTARSTPSRGNYNWMKAREGVMSSPVLGADLQKLYPISFASQSDTATFDNCP